MVFSNYNIKKDQRISYTVKKKQYILQTTLSLYSLKTIVYGPQNIFFSCIAGLVRDMVGQQLELVEIVTNFPKNKKQQQQTTHEPGTGPGRNAREICKLSETNETRNPCQCLDVNQINTCTWLAQVSL